MKRTLRLLAFPLFLFSCLSAEELLNAREHTLKNGLKVLLVEDHHSPLIVSRLYFKVGSVNETIGKSGISHMLEHMMFKGTKRMGVADTAASFKLEPKIDSLFRVADALNAAGDSAKYAEVRTLARKTADEQRAFHKNNELWDLYQKEGGTSLNAWTGDDMTAYIVTLPSSKLELFLWLESDRMLNPVMREFYTERDVVIEERRMRYEDSPYGRFYETLFSTFYEAHPYRIPTIGYMSDLKQLKRDDAFNHFRKYYTPNNAMLILVGDFNSDSALKQVDRYFGSIPRGPALDPVVTHEPIQIGQKRITVKKDAAPIVMILFPGPEIHDSALFPLDLSSSILSGKSGRLWKKLVDGKKLCTSISASLSPQKYGGYFMIQAELTEEAKPAEVEQIIFEELATLRQTPVSERELEKVKNQAEADRIRGLRSNEGLADQLAWAENAAGSWRFLNLYANGIRGVTKEHIQVVATRYLTEKNSTVGTLVREKTPEVKK